MDSNYAVYTEALLGHIVRLPRRQQIVAQIQNKRFYCCKSVTTISYLCTWWSTIWYCIQIGTESIVKDVVK